MKLRSDLGNRRKPKQVDFDGVGVTASAAEFSNVIHVQGHKVLAAHEGMFLAIQGGVNFVAGAYQIMGVDPGAQTYTLNRPCSTGAATGLTGKMFRQTGQWHKPVPEYYDASLPNNVSQGEARELVLRVLNEVEPEILRSLATTCFQPTLLAPPRAGDHDWLLPLEELEWGHIVAAGDIVPAEGWVVFGNLKAHRDAFTLWARGGPSRKWNLCDDQDRPLNWIAGTAVQTWAGWIRRGGLPKTLCWENLDFYGYRTLETPKDCNVLDLERGFDASNGMARINPGPEHPGFSDREHRLAKREHKALGKERGLIPLKSVSHRYVEWYILRTFFGWKLREIREREFRGKAGFVGNPKDPQDFAHVSLGIKQVADLVGFRRRKFPKRTKSF